MPKPKVNFSNLDKVFFPKTGFTKGDMVKYYVDVASHMLPHLKNRPVSMVRFPDGVQGERFFEKNAPHFAPGWIKTHAVPRKSRPGEINYILINDAPTLAWCANIAALELHLFLHRAPALTRPTHVVFDFDPGAGANLVTCAAVAFHVKAILDQLGLEGFPKVSGSKGLQLYVPLNTPATYAATSAFAKAVAELLERQHPKLVVSKMAKVERRGKVFIDWSQNSASKTTVAVYSLRGKRDEPYVSMPVTWDELKRLLKSRDEKPLFFSPDAALKRLAKLGDLFAPVLTLKQKLPKGFDQAGRGLGTSRSNESPGQATAHPKASPSPAHPRRSASLDRYRRKRDFSVTDEPGPEVATSKSTGKSRRFVIQKHDASRLHYDFRLEMDGVLKSWAVPKGLATEAGVKHAAFEVEDHPLNYMKFEGTIPKGQYGGGTVMVWDIGTYDLLEGSKPGRDLKVHLHGKKLNGVWHLFHIRSEDDKPVWLIVKSKPSHKPLTARQDDRSVLTQRSMAGIARDNDAQWQSR